MVKLRTILWDLLGFLIILGSFLRYCSSKAVMCDWRVGYAAAGSLLIDNKCLFGVDGEDSARMGWDINCIYWSKDITSRDTQTEKSGFHCKP